MLVYVFLETDSVKCLTNQDDVELYALSASTCREREVFFGTRHTPMRVKMKKNLACPVVFGIREKHPGGKCARAIL